MVRVAEYLEYFMKKLVCFHLFNDFSGSPKVLRMVLGGLAEKGIRIDVVTSKGEGALSDLKKYPNVKFYGYSYRFSDNPVVTMGRYVGVQVYIFCWLSVVGSVGILFSMSIRSCPSVRRWPVE